MAQILKIVFALAMLVRVNVASFGQSKLAFVSDTQEPLWVESLFLKSNQNVRATEMIFKNIIKQKPTNLFILGDVVSLGFRERKWKRMDVYIQHCREAGIAVSALLGNHDVMGRAKKGQERFEKRFTDHSLTGFVKVTDSIAVVFVNSNFRKLSAKKKSVQQEWLQTSLSKLDKDGAIQTIIVACHHAPFSNSKIVGASQPIQQIFVPPFLQSKKARLFITGHSHAFEHFKKEGKDFLVIGGGGGIHQPLRENGEFNDAAASYKPMFHYVTITRGSGQLHIISHFLKDDFSGFERGYQFDVLMDTK